MRVLRQGYDISNYRVIDPRYGSIEDVDVLRDRLHERGMKLVMDLVMNHTSDQHEWFKQSRSSRTNKYRDWYIWKPARLDSQGNRQPPNNWVSHFQGTSICPEDLLIMLGKEISLLIAIFRQRVAMG